jgi:cytochrome c553
MIKLKISKQISFKIKDFKMKKLTIFAIVLIAFLGCGDEKKAETTPTAKVEAKPSELPVAKAPTSILPRVSEPIPSAIVEVKKAITFTACASCHGANGDKKALNVSNILKGQTKESIVEKLNGYKDGTYGGNMKNIMLGQVKNLTSEDINILADTISKF